MVPAALRDMAWRRHTGVRADRGIKLCKERVLELYHSGIVPGGALLLSVYMHRFRSHSGELTNAQHSWPVIGGDFQADLKQLDERGWLRAVGGFVGAPQLATVTPSHRVIDSVVVSQDLAGASEATN